MPSSIIAGLAYVGVALGATAGTATAAIVGGVVVGAVVGGAVSAIRGGNILKGALIGGVIGGVAGGIGSALSGAGAAAAEAGTDAALAAEGAGATAGTLGVAEGGATALETAAASGISNVGGSGALAEGALTGAETASAALPTSTSLAADVPWTFSAAPEAAAAKTGVSSGLLGMENLSKAMAIKSGIDLVGGAAKGYGESSAADDQMDRVLAAKKVTPATTATGRPLFTVKTTKPEEQAMSYRNFFPTTDIPAVSAQKGLS